MRVTHALRYLPVLFLWSMTQAQTPPTRGKLTPFKSDAELTKYFHDLSFDRYHAWQDQQSRNGCPATFKSTRKKAGLPNTIIVGTIGTRSHGPVGGAQVLARGFDRGTATRSDGTFRLELPVPQGTKNLEVPLVVRFLGLAPLRDQLKISAGDSIEVHAVLCSDPLRLDELVVTGVETQTSSVTNVQHAGVDEGGIVKLHGNHLVILRRGRLFTVALGDTSLRAVASLDASGPNIDPRGTWYDEMLIYRDRIVVVGYSYARGGTELGIFHIDSQGGLQYQDTYQLRSNDYYSARNYASRLIGRQLVFYTPFFVGMDVANPLGVLPAMRRWGPEKEKGRFERLVTPQTVFHSNWNPGAQEAVVVHSVTTCDLSKPDITCTAAAVVGGVNRSFYVSPNAVYVWTGEGSTPEGRMTASSLVRFPLNGARPGSLGVDGTPIDQFSFLEGDDGWLNVLVQSRGGGDAMWRAERSVGDVALLRVQVRSFEDGTQEARQAQYRDLPKVAGILHDRFVGSQLLYGTGNGWGYSATDTASLFVVPLGGGRVARFALPHGADRIEAMGQDAAVIGQSDGDLLFTGVALGERPELIQRFTLPGASQGELRSHGFFYRADGRHTGILGLPFRAEGEAGYAHLFKGSAGVIFVENSDHRFTRLGVLEARADSSVRDTCVASCVDWYGNARPLFVGSRVFALMGYEIVEGVFANGGIHEVRRLNFMGR